MTNVCLCDHVFYNAMTETNFSLTDTISLNLLDFQLKYNKHEEEFFSMILFCIFSFYVDLHREILFTRWMGEKVAWDGPQGYPNYQVLPII